MKVGIFGIGAIGTVISFSLSEEHSPFYFNRSDKHSLILNFQEEFLTKKIQLSKKESKSKLDWLLVCLKEYQYSDAAIGLKNQISTKTKVAVIRNGIELKNSVLKFTNSDMILECMINAPTQRNADKHFHLLSFPEITTNKSKLAKEFSTLFSAQKIKVNQTEDFKTENWKKLIESASLGAIMCITNKKSIVFQEEKYVALYKTLVLEAIYIAQIDGAKLDASFHKTLLENLKTYGDAKGSSMLTDKIMGKAIELNAKNGAIVNVAERLGVSAPFHQKIVDQLT